MFNFLSAVVVVFVVVVVVINIMIITIIVKTNDLHLRMATASW